MFKITRLSRLQLPLLITLLCLDGLTLLSADSNAHFIYINTTQQTLSVIQNGKAAIVFENISIGKGGASKLRKRGDSKTPLGEFKITWINESSRYRLFFGIDFPNIDYAIRAYQAQIINLDEFISIQKSYARKQLPSQETELGGYIGIHGIGNGDLNTHLSYNWTDGCIALTNKQILQLAKWINIGMKVIITS